MKFVRLDAQQNGTHPVILLVSLNKVGAKNRCCVDGDGDAIDEFLRVKDVGDGVVSGLRCTR